MILQGKNCRRVFWKNDVEGTVYVLSLCHDQCISLGSNLITSITEITTFMNQRIAIALIALATITRLLPHPHNFTPLAAIALFGAAYFGRQYLLLLVPFASLFLSDLFINNVIYADLNQGSFVWITSGWLYLAFALVMVAGSAWLHNKVSVLRVLGASLSGSMVFFLVSNFSTWLESGMYALNLSGLMACYTAGIPFFGNTVMGDLVFSGLLFGAYAWLTRKQEIIA